MRRAGILLPISSLNSKYGIGSFSKEAYKFIDWLKKSGQSYWQILPIGPTSFGDSPYQSFSSFAGNPYFVDLERLIEENLLEKQDCDSVNFGKDERLVDYEKQYSFKIPLLKKAFIKFKPCEKYEKFTEIISMSGYETSYSDKNGKTKEFSSRSTNWYLNGNATSPENVTVLGGKTGVTSAAQHCLLIYSKDTSGAPYISVILKSESRDVIYKQMSELLDGFPKYPSTQEVSYKVTDESKARIVAEVRDRFKAEGYEVIDIDGARVIIGHGWGLVRASNTGPNLTIKAEADTMENAEKILEMIKQYIEEAR